MDLIHNKNPYAFTNPDVISVGGCCFRQFNREYEEKQVEKPKLSPYMDNDDLMINCAELEDEVDIQVTKSGKYLTEMHVAPCFFPAIIGTKGSKRREIEMDTGTQLKIPKKEETGNIIITGSTERDVISARNRVNMIVLQIRDKHQMTHFVSIPLLSEQLKFNFEKFKSNILNGPPLRGIDETLFQNPDKFHLTIAPLVLLDNMEKDQAIMALQECKNDIIIPAFRNTPSLKIKVEGLEIMNDDPTEVDVLYGKVKLDIHKYTSTFQKVADDIAEHFAKKGLIRKQYDSVKLHVTLLNSLFRRSNEENANARTKRETFDASYILEKYRNYVFGEAIFNSIHLSIRFTTSDNNYYESLFTVDL